jgi:mono/diheme cytochrome c family protein
MIKLKTIHTFLVAVSAALLLVACEDDLSPGVEYMPDMYRSPAIEPYVDYINNDSVSVRPAPEHAVPVGYRPYPYENTMEGYEESGAQLKLPMEVTEQTMIEGKRLYTSFCAHCHGPEGKGKGSIQNPIYGAVPSYTDETPNRRGNRSMSQLKVGHIYHTIMYGLNAMGPHSSLIREEDRWKIVAYVQKLQGNDPLEARLAVEEEEEMNDDPDSIDDAEADQMQSDSLTTNQETE